MGSDHAPPQNQAEQAKTAWPKSRVTCTDAIGQRTSIGPRGRILGRDITFSERSLGSIQRATLRASDFVSPKVIVQECRPKWSASCGAQRQMLYTHLVAQLCQILNACMKCNSVSLTRIQRPHTWSASTTEVVMHFRRTPQNVHPSQAPLPFLDPSVYRFTASQPQSSAGDRGIRRKQPR